MLHYQGLRVYTITYEYYNTRMVEQERNEGGLTAHFQEYVKGLDPAIFGTDHITTVELSKLPGGHSNVTYLTTINDESFVMRFHPREQDGTDHTAEEYKKLKRLDGHHAPRALFLGKPDFIKSSVLIMDFVPGEHKDFSTLSPDEIQNFALAVADIHSITQKGVFAKTPDIPEDVKGTYYDYLQSHIAHNIENRFQEADPALYEKDNAVIQEARKKLRHQMEEHKDAFSGNDFSYSHNDLVKLNILWKDNQPTVIDWEVPCYGDRADEIAYIFAVNNTSDQFQVKFLEAYEKQLDAQSVDDPTFRERLKVYILKHKLFDLAWSISMLDEEQKGTNPLMKQEEGLYRRFYDDRLKSLKDYLKKQD